MMPSDHCTTSGRPNDRIQNIKLRITTMKNISNLASIVAALILAGLPAQAATYTDATGDFTGGPAALDLTSVTVNNDATTLTFTLNLAGDPTPANWYSYFIGISENLYGGVGGNLNGSGGWGKDIQMSTGGMDYFVGGYPAFSGYSLLTWGGSAWTSTSGAASQDISSVTLSMNLSSLGLSAGNSFTFDVWTSTSGADTVLDALSDNAARSWNSTPFNTGANALTYTVEPVPEPATWTLLGLGALVMTRRLIRRTV